MNADNNNTNQNDTQVPTINWRESMRTWALMWRFNMANGSIGCAERALRIAIKRRKWDAQDKARATNPNIDLATA